MILVTGGAGFIASHLCEALLARGETVVCMDNFNDYYDPSFKRENAAILQKHADFTLVEADIRNAAAVRRVIEEHKPEKIAHLAARAGVRASLLEPALYEAVNIGGTLNLLNAARELGVEQFVFGSTSSAYGASCEAPFSESEACDRPVSVYAATKRAAEMLCFTHHHLYALPVTCLRFFTVFGPRGRPDMAPYKFTRLIERGDPIEIYGDGSALRDFTYVEDIVQGVVLALDKPFPYEIINLGNNRPVSVNYFIGVVESCLGKKADARYGDVQPGDVPMTCADLTKAKRLLGFQPTTSLEEGMARFVEWYRASGRADRGD